MRRPILRYHGSKWRIAPWIISLMPPHRCYVESYGGGAGVMIRKPRAAAEVYNDMDEDVVNVFRVLQDPKSRSRLEEGLRFTPYSRREFERSYEPADDPVERARRTIIRSHMAHGTTWQKENGTGFRSKPFTQRRNAADTWGSLVDHVEDYTERLRGVAIECRPALDVILHHDSPDTLHYVDPPYVLSTRTTGARYRRERAYRYNLTDQEHRELGEVLNQVEGMVLVSGYDCELYTVLYAGWDRHERTCRTDAGLATEVLWMSPSAARRAVQGELLATAGVP